MEYIVTYKSKKHFKSKKEILKFLNVERYDTEVIDIHKCTKYSYKKVREDQL